MKAIDKNQIALIGLTASKKLTKSISKCLDIPETQLTISHFADGETMVRSEEPLRNRHIMVVQSTSKPVNENVMELLIAIDSFKRASAKSINIIIPYYGYARQDRKTSGREPITSKLVAKLLESAGATRVAILDVHSEQAQGFFDIPMDTLPSLYLVMKEVLKTCDIKNTVIVSPDYGGVKRARKIGESYKMPIAILDKRRPKVNCAEIVNILGDVKDKNCIIFDDIIDTGGTIIAACRALRANGAKKIIVAATHGLFSRDAKDNLNKAVEDGVISKIYVTNSIEGVYDIGIKNLHIIDLAAYLSKVIKIYMGNGGDSISKMYEKE